MNAKLSKKTLVLAAALCLVLAAGMAAAQKYEEKFTKTEALAMDGKLILVNISGKVEIKTWDKAEVLIDAVKRSEASSEEKAKENAAKVTIEVSKTGNQVRVETKYPEGRFPRGNSINVSVDYIVTIPAQAALQVRNVSGSVDAGLIGGPVEIDVVSGNATVVKAAQAVDCRTVSGRVTVSDVGSDVDLKTVSGSISAERIKGSVSAETTSGGIKLRDVAGAKSVRAKVLSGSISFEGDVMPGGRYNFEALSGGINLTLPAAAGFDLEAETFSGHIQSEFAVTMQGKLSPKELRGTVGAGGATLRVKSFSGSVELKKK